MIQNVKFGSQLSKNKLGFSKKIYARKCEVKEISSKVSSDFLEKNHLQGNINALIRLGLFYDKKLVSVMTFGKTRRKKWKGENHYELLRFCTLRDYYVIGGASKLLKYFERKYKPKLLISYSNSRWSNGNLYEKLGFEFLYETKPNYFYFKGDDSCKLFSREKFQKYKLEKLLENFNDNLTEIENMINHGYRIIFDYGNKIFVKKYK